MSRFFHGVLQVVLTVGNAAVAASGAIPAPYNFIVVGGVSAVQGIIAIVNHARGK